MSENKDGKERKTLSLSGKSTLSLKTPPAASSDRSGNARSKSVEVQVVKKRNTQNRGRDQGRHLSNEERESRLRALKQAQSQAGKPAVERFGQTSFKVKKAEEPVAPAATETPTATAPTETPSDAAPKKLTSAELREREMAKMKAIKDVESASAQKKSAELTKRRNEEKAKQELAEKQAMMSQADAGNTPDRFQKSGRDLMATEEEKRRKKAAKKTPGPNRRDTGRLTVNRALNSDYNNDRRTRSLAAQKRAREKERMKASQQKIEHVKQVRDVILPEVITVAELANRMAERTVDVVKSLMAMDVMVTPNQNIDADTAELVIEEFGHKVKRVSDSDVEFGIRGAEENENEEDLQQRPPVVTIMGHVDHGKTSLLDAIRTTNVTSGEAGGITQHIGAYQINIKTGEKVTFIDTPGHAAFSEMRARGADVTDIVILVVAANDSVMPQTIEAISHAKAANKPMIVAINKCDLPDADSHKVKTELLQYEVMVEEMGGETQCIEVSAKTGKGLDTLLESIILQSEILELKANANRSAIGAVVEAKMEQGRGSVATVLIQKGTLNVGDIFVSGCEWGKVRALVNDQGRRIKTAIPGQPIEISGLNGAPNAGDDFVVVDEEAKAREIAEFRTRKVRAIQAAKSHKGSLEELMSRIQQGEAKELCVVIKGDVHGSIEALSSSLNKLTEDNDEVKVNILHQAVGGITESDVTLANASGAMIIAFNVRANNQARQLAKAEGIELRYYSIIYEVIDDVKQLLGGMLSPEMKEEFTGYAEIRQVFNITKVGKVAGCMVTSGVVKRASKVRLLRDDVVIHEGMLRTLQRFKDEVKEARDGFECGMAFENYDDIKEGDMIEAFEVTETARSLDDVQASKPKGKKDKKDK